MPEVVQEYTAYKQADLDALKLRFRARARLGRAISSERKREGTTQPQVAEKLGVVQTQIARYEAAYRQWLREYPEEPLG
jgi:DNA-directed RNA polymerase specialized sigma subunit